MNDMQKKAVFQVDGPVLILAGAGSGKTTVMVNRIAYMINYGDSYKKDFAREVSDDDIAFLREYSDGKSDDKLRAQRLLCNFPIKPWNILAITFTNKAAGELKERLQKLLGDSALDINAGTFHSTCARILRREIERLGYEKNFTIYDTDDGQRVIKDTMKDLNFSTDNFKPKAILSEISRRKDKMITPQESLTQAGSDYYAQIVSQIYDGYQKKLKNANAVDFDDMICLTVRLLEQFPEVLEYYQNRFKYIMIDEYQDTNFAQYRLVSLLSEKNENICVVGDDDQSIYRFRGATIENILNFESQFSNATVIKLEQNYRSTGNILNAANNVIKNNVQRKGKDIWTDKGDGNKIEVHRSDDEMGEASFITDQILANVHSGGKYSDHAVLYRMNAQSNSIERMMARTGITYKIIGGTKFFDRKEVKDVLSYMAVVNNPSDSVRLKRIINEPKRGIGTTTVEKAEQIAYGMGDTVYSVLQNADTFPALSKKSTSLMAFSKMIEDLREFEENNSLDEFFDELIEKTGYIIYLISLGEEGKNRIENVNELKSNILKHMDENKDATLAGFLEEVSLYTDLDSLNNDEDYVTLMTIHAAKGLEFPFVFVAGMEDNIFPGRLSMGNMDEMQEERRLAYVAITRAKEKLSISHATSRVLFGQTQRNRPSVFISEIPEDLKDLTGIATPTRGATIGTYTSAASSAPSVGSVFDKKPKPANKPIDYAVGDKVTHITFGDGQVLSMSPMANDVMVEVAFDKIGTKKIMANFAKLEKKQ